eukprot:932386-Prorocentrum_minimum.AAC.6
MRAVWWLPSHRHVKLSTTNPPAPPSTSDAKAGGTSELAADSARASHLNRKGHGALLSAFTVYSLDRILD